MPQRAVSCIITDLIEHVTSSPEDYPRGSEAALTIFLGVLESKGDALITIPDDDYPQED